VLRGFDGDRIRVLVDGIGSIDASSVSADHAVVLDPLTIDHVDVLHGPAVLLFGGQAIGGAVNALDKRIPRSVPSAPQVTAMAGYGSAADERPRPPGYARPPAPPAGEAEAGFAYLLRVAVALGCAAPACAASSRATASVSWQAPGLGGAFRPFWAKACALAQIKNKARLRRSMGDSCLADVLTARTIARFPARWRRVYVSCRPPAAAAQQDPCARPLALFRPRSCGRCRRRSFHLAHNWGMPMFALPTAPIPAAYLPDSPPGDLPTGSVPHLERVRPFCRRT
jgi:hypothetical protein